MNTVTFETEEDALAYAQKIADERTPEEKAKIAEIDAWNFQVYIESLENEIKGSEIAIERIQKENDPRLLHFIDSNKKTILSIQEKINYLKQFRAA